MILKWKKRKVEEKDIKGEKKTPIWDDNIIF